MAARLVLLPGLICDRRIFSGQLERFDAHVVNGFGLHAGIPEMAGYVLRHAPTRMSLLGHSMGARVALEIYRAAPERVERLALVSTGVHPVKPGEAEKRFSLRDLGRKHGTAALVEEWVPPMVSATSRGDKALMDRLRAMCMDAGVDAFEAQITALLNRPEVEYLLPTINVPVLVSTGELDIWSPPAQHEMIAAAVPQALLRIIKNAGHMLPVEAPEALNDAIAEWLLLPKRD